MVAGVNEADLQSPISCLGPQTPGATHPLAWLPRISSGARSPLPRPRLGYFVSQKPFSYFARMCIVGWVMDDPSPSEPFVSSRLCVTQTGAEPADSRTDADGGPAEMPQMPLPHPEDGPPPRFGEEPASWCFALKRRARGIRAPCVGASRRLRQRLRLPRLRLGYFAG